MEKVEAPFRAKCDTLARVSWRLGVDSWTCLPTGQPWSSVVNNVVTVLFEVKIFNTATDPEMVTPTLKSPVTPRRPRRRNRTLSDSDANSRSYSLCTRHW